MKNKHDILAIIPARSGSKRLPGKNVLDFAGKPLIAWTIEAALNSKYITRVIVSTNDKETADIAIKYGAEVPFLRDINLSTDQATTVDVVLDLIDKIDQKYKYIALLQPTSPLRTAQHIDESVEQLGDSEAIVSVVKTEHPIEWSNTLQTNNSMDDFIDDSTRNKRSQDLPIRYRINGAIYITKTEKLVIEKTFQLRKGAVAYKMDSSSSVDIDESQDFVLALINQIGLNKALNKLNDIQ